jgi:MFS family permease
MQTAVPFLALQCRATEIMLGRIGWVAEAVRLPICLTSGRLSEKTGRPKIIIPAACVVVLACIGLSQAPSYLHVIIFYTLGIAALGAFYPPLQALIGDVSKRGELTKNLGAFNIGWCVGGASAGLAAGWLIGLGFSVALYVAAASALAAGLLVVLWRTRPARAPRSAEENLVETQEHPTSLLLVARMGHFTGFFAFAVIRILFPKLGLSFGWPKPEVAVVVAMLLVGQAGGILATSASPWWRGKFWPQMTAQGVMLGCAIVGAIASSPVLLGCAFFGIGAALGVAYTAALYHGLSDRKARGKNTGIHESLVAAGNISGCLLGSLVAQLISPRAPYILLACLAGTCLIATAALSREHFHKRHRH